MESQQPKKHLRASAKTAPLASQKITSKQVTVSAACLIHVQSLEEETLIIETV